MIWGGELGPGEGSLCLAFGVQQSQPWLDTRVSHSAAQFLFLCPSEPKTGALVPSSASLCKVKAFGGFSFPSAFEIDRLKKGNRNVAVRR